MSSQPISEFIASISDDESDELSVFDTLYEEIMNNPSVSTGSTTTYPSADDIEMAMGTLDLDEPTGADIEEVIEDEEVVGAPELSMDELDVGAAADDEELRDLEVSLAKVEAYETTESEIEVMPAEEVVEAIAATKAAPKPKATKAKSSKPAAPKVERDLKALPAEAFVLTDEPPASLDANKDEVIASRPTQKKIAEKFDQTIAALHAGRLPSVYVVDCFKILHAKKTVLATDLIAALKAEDYSDGTARSQVGQIMALFPVLGIAERTKGMLTLNENSTFAKKLEALIV